MKNALKIAAVVLMSTAATAAHADRWPNKAERASITSVLKANGFVSWGEIELDDGRWEVDNARHASGRVYDLDIRGGRIVNREREWD